MISPWIKVSSKIGFQCIILMQYFINSVIRFLEEKVLVIMSDIK